MKIIKKVLIQDATYWEANGFDSFGKPRYKNPVAIKVRWDDVGEISNARIIDTATGEEFASKAEVMVGFTPVLGSRIALGTFTAVNPLSVSTSERIRAKADTPTIKGDDVFRQVFL